MSISIHAPTWGATYFHWSKDRKYKFQSTHPRGVRRYQSFLLCRQTNDFNPRTHVGCDTYETPNPLLTRYFNPRTHVGCDAYAHAVERANYNFNPRTHVGCDFKSQGLSKWLSISIHAPTWGATVKPSNGWLLGHKDNEFANENIIIINSVNIT